MPKVTKFGTINTGFPMTLNVKLEQIKIIEKERLT